MCLIKVHPESETLRPKYGYKVVMPIGQRYQSFYWLTDLGKGEWVRCWLGKEWIEIQGPYHRGDKYLNGFHCWTELTSAMRFMNNWASVRTPPTIVQVEMDDIVASGLDEWKQLETVICRKLRITKEIRAFNSGIVEEKVLDGSSVG